MIRFGTVCSANHECIGKSSDVTAAVSLLAFGRIHVTSVLLLVEFAVFGAFKPAYLSVAGLLDDSRAFVEAGLLALGMTLVIITGGIDLSVASLLALVSVTIGFSSASRTAAGPLALVFGLLVGLFGRPVETA